MLCQIHSISYNKSKLTTKVHCSLGSANSIPSKFTNNQNNSHCDDVFLPPPNMNKTIPGYRDYTAESTTSRLPLKLPLDSPSKWGQFNFKLSVIFPNHI